MGQFNINRDKSIDADKVFLVDKQFRPIGSSEIYPVSDMKIVANLNSNWECNFTVYRENDGIENPLWDQIEYLSLVKIENQGIFELETPITDETGTYKQCSGVSICEAETSQTTMTLEINTEDDIARQSDSNPVDTYYAEFPTVFCRNIGDISVFPNDEKFNKLSDDEKTEILKRSSLLHRVFSEMPEYLANINIDAIDKSLRNLEYIFSWNDTSVYDICQNIAEEMQCLFIFDRFSRSFEVRDLKEHCEIDHCRDIKNGICPVCEKNGTTQKITSFGEYSGVEISTKNLAETITLSGDKDAVKNYFKIEGADDVITNRLSNRMIGNGYIWKLGELQKRQMSKELITALNAREQMMKDNDYENKYNALWDQWNQLEDERLEYQSGMMPSPETSDENAAYVYNYLFGADGKIDYAYATNRFQTAKQIADSVLNYAKLLISTNHTIEYDENSLTCTTETWNGHADVVVSVSFKPHIFLDGYYVDNDESKGYADEYTGGIITLDVRKGYDIRYSDGNHAGIYTTDYYDYLQRILDTAMAKSDVTDEVLTMEPKTAGDISPTATSYNGIALKPTHYSKYCYNRLKSFCDAYMSCTAVIAGINADIPSNTTKVDVLKYLKVDGSESNIQKDLLGKYDSYIERLSERMGWLDEKIKKIETAQNSLQKQIQQIRDICDMQNYITKYCEENKISRNLWYELCSFKRQDVYKNDNFIGEGIDDATLMENVENLLKRAEEEIEDACNIHYSVSATIDNLLTMLEFEPLWDKFQLGNYIHMIIDDVVHTMRLVNITYDYTDLSHCSVEFSDVVRKINKDAEIADILSQASSLATNAKTISRQAENGASAKLTVDIIKNDALNIANSKIITADDQSFTIDRYGITGKYIDPVSGEVSDEQIRQINNLLCFTDDGWKHTKTALGKITYLNPDTGEYETNYGLIADTIIGKLIMSEKLLISNAKNTVSIDGDGITLDGGAITWNNNNLPTSALNGYDDFIKNLNNTLGVTKITSDSVISPKIGGGYLYIVDGNNSITLNPHAGTVSDGKNKSSSNSMFEIVSNNKKVFDVNKNGDLEMTGTIHADAGYFSGEISSENINMLGGNLYIPINPDAGDTINTEKITVSSEKLDSQDVVISGQANSNGSSYFIKNLLSNERSYNFLKGTTYILTITSADSYGFHSGTIFAALSDSKNATPSNPGESYLRSTKTIKKDNHTFMITFEGDGNNYSHLLIGLGNEYDYDSSHLYVFNISVMSSNNSVAISANKIRIQDSAIKSELSKEKLSFTRNQKVCNLSFNADKLSSDVDFEAPNLQQKEWKRISMNCTVNPLGNILSTSSIFSIANEMIVSISLADNSQSGNYYTSTWHIDPATVPVVNSDAPTTSQNSGKIYLAFNYSDDLCGHVSLDRYFASVSTGDFKLLDNAILTISYR